MTCPACEIAAANPLTGLHQVGCQECSARMLSRGIEHATARAMGKMTPEYMARLREVFGEDWEAGHRQVKRWAQREIAG